MNSNAEKFMVALIMNLTRPETDEMKIGQLVVDWLICWLMAALATEVYESPTDGNDVVNKQAPPFSL